MTTVLAGYFQSPHMANGQTTNAMAIEILSAATASGAWRKCYESTTTIKYRAIVREQSKHYCVGDDSIVRKYREGSRLHIIIDLIDHLSADGTIVKRPGRRQLLFAADVRTMWWCPADKPLSGSAQVATSIERTRAMRVVAQNDVATGAFLDGYVDGVGNMVDVITALPPPINVHEEEWNGIKCDVVEAHTASTHAQVWLAASRGHSIVKYQLQKSDAATGPTEADAEATGFQNVDQYILVRSGRSHRTWVDQNTRAHWEETVEADRSELNLHPRFDQPDLFTTREVPNGMRVFLDELPNVGVDFVWKDGKPVPKVDDSLFDELDTSVERTAAGEVSKTPTSAELPFASPEASVDAGSRRFAQLWIVLGTSALAALALLVIAVGKRRRCAL
jgi:hypothetical protein